MPRSPQALAAALGGALLVLVACNDPAPHGDLDTLCDVMDGHGSAGVGAANTVFSAAKYDVSEPGYPHIIVLYTDTTDFGGYVLFNSKDSARYIFASDTRMTWKLFDLNQVVVPDESGDHFDSGCNIAVYRYYRLGPNRSYKLYFHASPKDSITFSNQIFSLL